MKKISQMAFNPSSRFQFSQSAHLSPNSSMRGYIDGRDFFSRPQGGRIELIIGPMFAGKTTELMRRLRREVYACRRSFIIKYSKDTRYSSEAMASHDKAMLKVNASVSCLSEIGNDWKEFDVIGIDEGQFFSDLLEFSTTAADAGKTVIISALDGDFCRKPFGQVCDLVPHCESVDKLTAVCMICHQSPGSFTRRTVTGNNEQELIGGADMYVATCRECFSSEQEISAAAVEKYKKSMKMLEDSFSHRSCCPSVNTKSSSAPSKERSCSPLKKQFKDEVGITYAESIPCTVGSSQ